MFGIILPRSCSINKLYNKCNNFLKISTGMCLKKEQIEENQNPVSPNAVYPSSFTDRDHCFELKLFEVLKITSEDKVSPDTFFNGLLKMGLKMDDPRLKDCISKINDIQSSSSKINYNSIHLTKSEFIDCIKDSIPIIKKAFTTEMSIPEFGKFVSIIDDIYWRCKHINDGKVCSLLPQLSRIDPINWGVSLCTVDGQRYSIGNTSEPFCLQSISKPLNYAIALNDLDSEIVHNFIGLEPSGESFNEIKLGINNKPHNPMINSGAIVTVSLLKNQLKLADRFDFITNQYKRLSGGGYLGFNNAAFLSERETSMRNYSLGHYLKENKCFQENANLAETLDLYFQLCSVETNCDSSAIIAASLANGGVCPITNDKILSAESIRNTLSMMGSCGMYDYSGQWAFNVGLPAKSSITGTVILVVPNLMGIALWSPPLDKFNNSVRSIEFCNEIIRLFNFHKYDNLKHTIKKMDPRRRLLEREGQAIISLLFGAFNGDVAALTRQHILGIDMNQSDYDGRTALHLAAAEGHLDCVRYLINTCHAQIDILDRWNFSPMDEAKRFGHKEVYDFLKNVKMANLTIN